MNYKIFLIAIIALCIDQISKLVVNSLITLNQSAVVIPNFFRITPHNNLGAAWGIFNGKTHLLIILSIIGFVIIYRYMRTFKLNNRNTLAFGILIGGIIGNLIDRIFLNGVRDFLDFNFGTYNFPIFNIADSCIVIAVVLLIYAIFKGEDKNDNKRW